MNVVAFIISSVFIITSINQQALSLETSPWTIKVLGNTSFTRTYSDGTETHLGLQASTCNRWTCAETCATSSLGQCTGFHYDNSSRTCQLYTGLVFGTHIPDSGKTIYRADQVCRTDLGFSVYHKDCHSMCLGFFGTNGQQKSYDDAKLHCQSMSARLLHVDDPELILATAEEILLENVYQTWLGVDDIQTEGLWQASWTGRSIPPLPWRLNEPTNSNGNEDCTWLVRDGVNDVNCAHKSTYICEAVP